MSSAGRPGPTVSSLLQTELMLCQTLPWHVSNLYVNITQWRDNSPLLLYELYTGNIFETTQTDYNLNFILMCDPLCSRAVRLRAGLVELMYRICDALDT